MQSFPLDYDEIVAQHDNCKTRLSKMLLGIASSISSTEKLEYLALLGGNSGPLLKKLSYVDFKQIIFMSRIGGNEGINRVLLHLVSVISNANYFIRSLSKTCTQYFYFDFSFKQHNTT